jgi:hypothetical protein
MKWLTAVGQVYRLAEQCSDKASRPADPGLLRVRELWAYDEILGTCRDLDWVSAALSVDLPVGEVPWLCRPVGADLWADLTRASKNPVGIQWRSVHAPVWNHRITGPVLVWDADDGVREDAMTALREGRGSSVASAAPSEEEFMARMDDELTVSLAELTRRTREYESEYTTRLGIRADALHAAAQGYLDVLAAHPRDPGRDES